MAHEQELVSLPAAEKEPDERWPVPYAILFIVGVSVVLWTVLIALSSWLVG
jgi:hypothetical protein